MKGVATIYRRELAGLFLTPLGWVLFFLAMILNGLYFSAYFRATEGGVNDSLGLVLGQSLLPFWVVMVLLPPLLTMRMISEDARSGMLEFLLTAPVRDAAVIAGKALAATTFLGLLWSTNGLYALLLSALGGSPDWGLVGANIAGALLVSALFTSFGLVASALTSTPLLAGFLAFVFNIAVVSISFVRLPGAGDSELVETIVRKVDVLAHFQSFSTGALDTADLVFFLAWTIVSLFLATRLLEARRWW